MKKFNGNRELEAIIEDAKIKGWTVDIENFEKGSDWIYLRDLTVRFKQIAFNVVNGSFYVYEPFSESATAHHLSTEFDNEVWYNEILELLYEPLTT